MHLAPDTLLKQQLSYSLDALPYAQPSYQSTEMVPMRYKATVTVNFCPNKQYKHVIKSIFQIFQWHQTYCHIILNEFLYYQKTAFYVGGGAQAYVERDTNQVLQCVCHMLGTTLKRQFNQSMQYSIQE